MGIYTRYKRSAEGFRQLVELLEATPMHKRARMIELGMAEDPEYTERALACMMHFDDLLALPEAELAEMLAFAPPRIVAFAIRDCGDEVVERFLKNAKPFTRDQIRAELLVEAKPKDIAAARLKLVTVTRELERGGRIVTKKIPMAKAA